MRTDIALKLGELYRNKPSRVFDWHKAARIIKTLGLEEAWAGLGEDWFYTGGKILEDGKPIYDDYTYLASTWATPILRVSDDIAYECWCWEDECDWDCHTKWPASAVLLMGDSNGLLS